MPQDPYQQLVSWWNSVRHSNEWKQYIPTTLPSAEDMVMKGLGTHEPMQYAIRRPADLGYSEGDQGPYKALRHLLLSAELHRTHPYLANPLLYGHEYLTNTLTGQSQDVRYKDLYNNSLGKYIGQRSTSRAESEAWAQAAMSHADTKDYALSDYQARVPPPDQPPAPQGRR